MWPVVFAFAFVVPTRKTQINTKELSGNYKRVVSQIDRSQWRAFGRDMSSSELLQSVDDDNNYTYLNDVVLVESMAIIQYLEETRPQPSLTPSTPLLRARMREICETVVSGIQPLQNFGLKPRFETEDEFQKFTRYFSEQGLTVLDELLNKSAGKYCIGDQLTLADVCLVPQVYNSVSRYSLDLTNYPTVAKLYSTLMDEKVFQETHPKSVRPKK